MIKVCLEYVLWLISLVSTGKSAFEKKGKKVYNYKPFVYYILHINILLFVLFSSLFVENTNEKHERKDKKWKILWYPKPENPDQVRHKSTDHTRHISFTQISQLLQREMNVLNHRISVHTLTLTPRWRKFNHRFVHCMNIINLYIHYWLMCLHLCHMHCGWNIDICIIYRNLF